MGKVEKILKVKETFTPSFTTPERQSIEATEDYSIKKVIFTKEVQTGDHNVDGTRPEVVNVCFGTSATLPTASDVPIGTIYVQYTD